MRCRPRAGKAAPSPPGSTVPIALTFDSAGNLYVANLSNGTVSQVTQTVTVPFTVGGSAVSGVDYSGVTAGPLTFGIGQTTQNITGRLLPVPGTSQTLTIDTGHTNGGRRLGQSLASTR